ncbi:phosphotransferase [Arthrobacter sp. zg-Y1143]|uniref:phosphotransferase n=1 Tax=Arthrobacter sp. zg-Y1143 TaxID=3049065 RepID=UPI0024C3C589|nr:phosphotransferase [Arthrobacter sp. zg-Y1143]MDK1327870.1 phosphotransferase [Arthrobacter sp. zg-Y1143]
MQEPLAIPDYRRTARRLPWGRLPAAVRDSIAASLDGGVSLVEPAGGGFTPGFAAVLGNKSGDRIFAKAAAASDAFIYPSYLRESQVVPLMLPGMPMPALRSAQRLVADGIHWQMLVYEAVPGRMPGQPWTEADVAAVETACVTAAALLTDFPQAEGGTPVAEDMALIPTRFKAVADGGEPPWFLPGLSAEEAGGFQEALDLCPEALAGDAVLHGDLRADNILISDGRALFCDWNFLGTGAPWIDWVGVLPYARADGIDADAWLRRSELTRDVPDAYIDALLAALLNYMIHWGSQPDVDTSPLLRIHGRHTARLVYDWLACRQG